MSYMVVVFVYDAVHAVFATMAVGTIDTDLAILDVDISTGILAIFTGRTCETDMAFAILSGNGDCILARLAVFARRTDGDLAIDAVLAIEAFEPVMLTPFLPSLPITEIPSLPLRPMLDLPSAPLRPTEPSIPSLPLVPALPSVTLSLSFRS